jgi:predicted phage terminase large subunit-like protein
VRPYIRATCNPDADSWVAEFVAWWIDPETAFPIPERAGVLRYYVRVAEKIVWADQPEDLIGYLPPLHDLSPGAEPPQPISVTFIPAKVSDNPALLQVNPQYLAWLDSLPLLERERLLKGNWKIRPAAGLYFKREWCTIVEQAPAISMSSRVRANPGDGERLIRNTAPQDGKKVTIGFGQDPGQAGKSQAQHLVCALSGFTVRPITESGDKLTRFGPFSSQCRVGNVKILRGLWNEDLCRVLEGFPDLAHDDEVDACSRALEMLNPEMKARGLFEFYRQEAERVKAERAAAPKPAKPTYAPGSMEYAAQQQTKRRGSSGDG